MIYQAAEPGSLKKEDYLNVRGKSEKEKFPSLPVVFLLLPPPPWFVSVSEDARLRVPAQPNKQNK